MSNVSVSRPRLFASCFEVGARAAGASEEKAQICFRMGEEFGIAYQIVDDLVEFTEIDDANKKSLQQSYILPLVYMESMSREQAIGACMAQVERRIAAIEKMLEAFPDGEPKQKLRQGHRHTPEVQRGKDQESRAVPESFCTG